MIKKVGKKVGSIIRDLLFGERVGKSAKILEFFGSALLALSAIFLAWGYVFAADIDYGIPERAMTLAVLIFIASYIVDKLESR